VKKKTVKKIRSALIRFVITVVVIVAVAGLCNFALDTYAVPMLNQSSLDQLNGDAGDWQMMRTKQKTVSILNSATWGFLALALGVAIVGTGTRIVKAVQKDSENEEE